MKTLTLAAIVALIASPVMAQEMDPRVAAMDLTPWEESPEVVCVVSNTVRLGRGNTESADTILRAAWAACREHEATINQQARGRAVLSRYEGTGGTEVQWLAKIREDIEGAATLALLEARAS